MGRPRGKAPAPSPVRREIRLQSPLDHERGFWSRGVHRIAGIDEVGRGPLAGPVVAAAVILSPNSDGCGADDSKRLSPQQRAELATEIFRTAAAVAIGAASAGEIDRINIRRATALAMRRALRRLPLEPEHILVDGLAVPELGLEWQTAIVAGDQHVQSIACASIIAKVCRDRLMERLATKHPLYGWERNKGYATDEHREALRRHGPSPHHRRSFQTIDQLSLLPEPI